MAADNPLANLKDIHLPDPISIWPLAPGWYVLMGLCLLLISAILYGFYRKYQQGRAKREALALLDLVEKNYQETGNSQLACASVADLLKRMALIEYPRKEVASLYGERWIQFLNKTSKTIDFSPVSFLLLEAPFKQQENVDATALFPLAKMWIKQRRGKHV